MNYGYYQPNYNTGAMPDMLGQYRQMQQPQIPQTQQVSGGMIWVQGEAGAKSYMVAPNNTVVLWDSEEQRIYIKSADASGMPAMKVLEYNERTAMSRPQETPQKEYVTIDAFNELKAKFDTLAAMVKGENNNG